MTADVDFPPPPKGAVPIGGFPPPPKGAVPIAAPKPPSPQIIPNPNQAEAEVVRGPTEGGNTEALFNQQRQIEARLRAAGKNPETDSEWQAASKNLSRSVSANQTGTAMWGAGGDLMPIAGAAKAALQKGGQLVKGAVQGTKPALDAVTQIGSATDKSVLGQKMFGELKQRMNALLKTRSAAEKELRATYLAEGIPKEGAVANAYQDRLIELFNQNGHPVQQRMINELFKNIADFPSMNTLVIEKRRLEDIASGHAQGWGAVEQTLAGKMAAALKDTLVKEVPSYGKYLNTYGKMSEDINLFEDHALGQRVTKETSEFLPDIPKFDPNTLPPKAFSSKQSMDILLKLSGGNKQLVNDMAGEHVASSLKDLSAPLARAWLTKNKEWLDAVPKVQADAERYVANLEKVSHTTERTRKMLGAAAKGGAATAGGGIVYQGLKHFGVVP